MSPSRSCLNPLDGSDSVAAKVLEELGLDNPGCLNPLDGSDSVAAVPCDGIGVPTFDLSQSPRRV